MKQIKNLLFFKKGIQTLKNQKGFSLLEVLIAVAIIGIISAIAVPQFAKQREDAARVAADTSASNIVKAFQNCSVLKGFSACNTLENIGVSCPSGSDCDDETNGSFFCVDLKRGTPGQDDFNVCIEMNSQSNVAPIRTYGGELLTAGNVQVCKQSFVQKSGQSQACPNTDAIVTNPLKVCGGVNDCSTANATNPDSNKCEPASGGGRSCSNTTTSGKCQASGRCA